MEERISEVEDHGSIASGGPSTCGTPEGCHALYQEFCKALFNEKITLLGDMIRKAKESIISNSSNQRIYGPAVINTLFGDPALRIKYLNNPISIKNTISMPKNNCPILITHNLLKVDNKGVLTVYSLSGQVVLRESVCKNSTLKLNNGVYLVKFYDAITKGSYLKNITISK